MMEEDPPESTVCLDVTLNGFASTSPDSQVAAEAIALAKQVSFLLVFRGLATSATWKGVRSHAQLIDIESGEERALNLPDRLALHLGGLEPNGKRPAIPS